ncbi:MAG: F0F1 ATP synthase subunit delta [Pseudomonadota bacterium]
MPASTTLVSGIAGRYATALFEIAVADGRLDAIEGDLDTLAAALDESADLRDVISSPLYPRDEQGAAMAAIARALGLGQEVTGTIGVMAGKRRLFALPGVIAGVKALAAERRGEITAAVASARPLTDAERTALAAALKDKLGRDVTLDLSVDESLIGGLVVRVGSRLIDSSIKAKLAGLQNAMKGT